MTGVARTVLGDIPVSSLGRTLVHEHLRMDTTPLAAVHGYVPDPSPGDFDLRAAAECRWNPGAHPDNYRFTEHDAVLEDLLDLAALGGRTIVDATPVDLGRDPQALARFALESGLNVVMGTGYYLEATHRPFITPGDEERASYDLILAEHAAQDSIRPGMIGEIGTSDPPTEGELRSLRGAARAAIATGLPLSVHLHPWGDNSDRVLDTIGETGLELSRVLLNHMSTAIGDDERITSILSTGVLVSFDLCGFDHSLLGPGRYPPSDDEAMATTVALLSGPHSAQVMISQDVGVRTRLRRYGGWGYGHALRHLVPLLESHGASAHQLDQLLVQTPASFLTTSPVRR